MEDLPLSDSIFVHGQSNGVSTRRADSGRTGREQPLTVPVASHWVDRVEQIPPSSIVNTCITHSNTHRIHEKEPRRAPKKKSLLTRFATGTVLPSGTPHWHRWSWYTRYTANSQHRPVVLYPNCMRLYPHDTICTECTTIS